MKKFKDLLLFLWNILLPVKIIKGLFKISKEELKLFGKGVLTILAPLLFFFLTISVVELVFWFLSWDMPSKFYFPFMYKEFVVFDRGLLLLGVLILMGIIYKQLTGEE